MAALATTLRPSTAGASPRPLLRKLLFSSIISPRFPAILSVKPAIAPLLRLRRSGIFQMNPQAAEVALAETDDRPAFDLNLAVLLAGFAFEAYYTPPDNVGTPHLDAAGCQTVFLSEVFVRDIYDGQLFVKVKKGSDLPIMDLWGTSDPYVVIQFDDQVAKTKVKWATKEPAWNEELAFCIKIPPTEKMKIAAWDANLVSPHKRMGYSVVDLDMLCDGNKHEVIAELEGIGGGGKIEMEIRYKSFGEIDSEKYQMKLPFVTDFLMKHKFGIALKMLLGSESVQARQFVESAFGRLSSMNYAGLLSGQSSSKEYGMGGSEQSSITHQQEENKGGGIEFSDSEGLSNPAESNVLDISDRDEESNSAGLQSRESFSIFEKYAKTLIESDELFWKNLANVMIEVMAQKLGLPAPDKLKWEGVERLKQMGVQSLKIAEAAYIESGLATPRDSENEDDESSSRQMITKGVQSSLSEIKKASRDLLKQTDTILGALMVVAAFFNEKERKSNSTNQSEIEKSKSMVDTGFDTESIVNGSKQITAGESIMDAGKVEEIKNLFSTAESAMEAWAMLATSLGRPSFIKSEFEKICFLDNDNTDTQVAIWRDPLRRRLVVAFRGTEQTSWKDLLTDLLLAPAGLNPERLGGDFKEELQVHSGFLSAYDSVRNRIMYLIRCAIGFTREEVSDADSRWQVFITGHSLGGALATLLALELCSSPMAKCGVISVVMYNFGSPRVGNKRFAEAYNKKVKDSWRIVNHRDIIPTVPRLMGYYHVAHPIYLAAGDIKNALANMKLSEDGYQGDVIGEYTPDLIVSEFLKGERQMVEKILQAEIDMFRSIRDGTALMQHMEDFYYITLLECVKSNYNPANLTRAETDMN